MTNTGSVNGKDVYTNEGSYFNYQLVDQTFPGNYSTINWQIGWRFPSTSCRGLRKGSVTIDGFVGYNNQTAGDGVHAFNSGHNHRPNLEIASGALNIAHDDDGTKTFRVNVSITGRSGTSTLVSSGSIIFTLPTIPKVPEAPTTPVATDISSTFMTVFFEPNGDGGAPVQAYQIGYGTDPSTQSSISPGYPPYTIRDLTPGTKYYVWARVRNIVGWSPWSRTAEIRTIAGVRVKIGGVWVLALPYVRDGGVWKIVRPWIRNMGIWKETV